MTRLSAHRVPSLFFGIVIERMSLAQRPFRAPDLPKQSRDTRLWFVFSSPITRGPIAKAPRFSVPSSSCDDWQSIDRYERASQRDANKTDRQLI